MGARNRLAAAAAATAAAAAAPASAATAGCADGALGPVLAHPSSAHLERSPTQQAGDAAKADEYALLHTVWLQSILGGAADPFVAHFASAHLERSPGHQVQDAAAADEYVLTHTVLVEHMLSGSGACEAPAPAAEPPPAAAEPAPAPASPPPPATGSRDVMVMGNKYSPAGLSVPAGTRVTWMNHDSVDHTVTSSGGGPLDSPSFGRNKTWSYTFATAGRYAYYCAIHPNMKGTVDVT